MSSERASIPIPPPTATFFPLNRSRIWALPSDPTAGRASSKPATSLIPWLAAVSCSTPPGSVKWISTWSFLRSQKRWCMTTPLSNTTVVNASGWSIEVDATGAGGNCAGRSAVARAAIAGPVSPGSVVGECCQSAFSASSSCCRLGKTGADGSSNTAAQFAPSYSATNAAWISAGVTVARTSRVSSRFCRAERIGRSVSTAVVSSWTNVAESTVDAV